MSSRRRHLHEINSRRCRRAPMYGTDLIRAVRTVCHHEDSNGGGRRRRELQLPFQPLSSPWLWTGYQACCQNQSCGLHWSEQCWPLSKLMVGWEQRTTQLEEVFRRFLIVIPPVTSSPPTLHTYHHSPTSPRLLLPPLRSPEVVGELSSRGAMLHPLATSTCFQFPETRLIQYDCGKLQTLSVLLHRLKSEGHRVLIFTQMARMLDVLEIFLNYHGHTYLRLDGATPVQKRQFLMDRFNRDDRIFCFILSTRSGGLGVNLTGADTVVFYDSDWNPTMDAQAQDRCHRIGQTRDVHIYRLVCGSTVEENILKKANQKRMLGDIAIEGGAFTTEFFKQQSLKELFKGGQELATPTTALATPTTTSAKDSNTGDLSPKHLEELLLQAEDENDAKAAGVAKAEQVAEMAEFDESFAATNTASKEKKQGGEESRVLAEFSKIEEQLSGVEKYAMKYLEDQNADFAAEQLRIAEENIELAKKDWELSHLQSLREEEEEKLAEGEVDDVLLTYDRPEVANKMLVDELTGEEMPVWLPPTPPADEGEDYIDLALEMAYDTQTTISPSVLVAMAPYSDDDYDVFGLTKRSREIEPLKKAQKSGNKQSAKEHVNVPPSLFWRRHTSDALSTKLKKLATHQKKLKSKEQFTPLLEQQPEGPEWSVFEDWILLKSVTSVLEFPLSLTISVPAQIPNWSIVADLTSSLSRIRRSPLQCREHLMNVVIPREDSTMRPDEADHSKKYKSRESTLKKSRSRREQRTKSLVLHDNSKYLSRQFMHSFDWVDQASLKRKQTPKFAWDSAQKPSMHSDLLKEYGIDINTVHSPMQIALQRAERLQSELPRQGGQVHQLLTQPYHLSAMVARGYHGHGGSQYIKPSASAGFGLPRPTGLSTSSVNATAAPTAAAAAAAASSQRFPTTSTVPFTSQTKVLQATPAMPSTLSVVPSATPAPPTSSTTTTLPSTVGKAFSLGMGDLNKTFARGALSHQQLLLLRQTTLQQQQQQSATPSPISTPPPQQQQQQQQVAAAAAVVAAQGQPSSVQPKLALPSGMEQLRATVALPLQQRFTTGVSSSSSAPTVRSITAGGRTMQAEEVLALLRQQSLSLRMQQAQSRAAVAAQLHSTREPSPSTPQLQFHTDGGSQLAKKSLASSSSAAAILQSEGVKLVQSASPAVTTDGIQLKVELVEQSQLQKAAQLLQKQTMAAAAVQKSASSPAVAKMTVQKAAASDEVATPPSLAEPQGAQTASDKTAPTTTASS